MTWFADFTSGQSNVSYTRMRQLLATSGGGLQEGVVGAGDLKVAQRAAGANMSVDVAVGDAWIQYDTGSRNGLSHVWSDAIANVLFNASNATNPRIDQIAVQLNDTAVGAGSGGNTPAPLYLPGTATAGATLDNRTGAAALPNDTLRLADILVPAASTSVVTANIRDRRPWARGGFRRVVVTAGDISVTGTTFAVGGNLPSLRMECSGTLLRVSARARLQIGAAAGNQITVAPFIDGALPTADVGTAADVQGLNVVAASTQFIGSVYSWDLVPAAGSHVVALAARVSAGTGTVLANAANALQFTVEEIVRPNASND